MVKPGYVVTNAHVVAGSNADLDRPRQRAAGQGIGRPLRSRARHRPPLRARAERSRADASPTRCPTHGTLAAALGHPDGGSLATIAAAVTNTYQAQGRDIYGTSIVSRQIIELQAAIQQGDSGGPLVLKDGTVGGVVFAEAQTDPNVGYALSPIAIEDRIQDGLTRKAPISTGDCTR